jgi:hypothetical protein
VEEGVVDVGVNVDWGGITVTIDDVTERLDETILDVVGVVVEDVLGTGIVVVVAVVVDKTILDVGVAVEDMLRTGIVVAADVGVNRSTLDVIGIIVKDVLVTGIVVVVDIVVDKTILNVVGVAVKDVLGTGAVVIVDVVVDEMILDVIGVSVKNVLGTGIVVVIDVVVGNVVDIDVANIVGDVGDTREADMVGKTEVEVEETVDDINVVGGDVGSDAVMETLVETIGDVFEVVSKVAPLAPVRDVAGNTEVLEVGPLLVNWMVGTVTVIEIEITPVSVDEIKDVEEDMAELVTAFADALDVKPVDKPWLELMSTLTVEVEKEVALELGTETIDVIKEFESEVGTVELVGDVIKMLAVEVVEMLEDELGNNAGKLVGRVKGKVGDMITGTDTPADTETDIFVVRLIDGPADDPVTLLVIVEPLPDRELTDASELDVLVVFSDAVLEVSGGGEELDAVFDVVASGEAPL